jgi:hypothetical protein
MTIMGVSAVLRDGCAWLLLAALTGACGSSESAGPPCLSELSLDCSPTYAPTFRAIFDNRLQVTCGAGGRSCHSSSGRQAGLVLDDFDAAYAALLGSDAAGRARVVPGDPECSLLEQRLESNDSDYVMPVGAKLKDGELCAVRQWIASGAKK